MMIQRYFEPFALKRFQENPSGRQIDEPSECLVGYYRGFIQPVGAGESNRFAKIDEEYTHRCYCETSVPALYNDTIERDGEKWTVIFSTQAQGISTRRSHKELLLRKV
jgi:hypothetical protein